MREREGKPTATCQLSFLPATAATGTCARSQAHLGSVTSQGCPPSIYSITSPSRVQCVTGGSSPAPTPENRVWERVRSQLPVRPDVSSTRGTGGRLGRCGQRAGRWLPGPAGPGRWLPGARTPAQGRAPTPGTATKSKPESVGTQRTEPRPHTVRGPKVERLQADF